MKKVICLVLSFLLVFAVSFVPAAAGDFIRGDANGDGFVRAEDARLALRFSADLAVNGFDEKAADVDGDGFVRAGDARLILRFAAKLISSFEPQNAPVVPKEKKIAMIGDSLVEGLAGYMYGGRIDYFGRKNVNTTNIYEKTPQGSSETILRCVTGKGYDAIIVLIGINEVGNYTPSYKSTYKAVINTLLDTNPGTEIWIHAILPVSEYVSSTSTWGVTNGNVNEKNAVLCEIAQETDCNFIDASPVFRGPNGALYPDAASDGIHPVKSYCEKWEAFLLAAVG